MFLQISYSESVSKNETFVDIQLILVILGLAIGVFIILKIINYLNKIKSDKSSEKPSYTS